MRQLTRLSTMILIGLLLLTACSKKASGPTKAIPADADVVVVADARALLAYAKDALERVVPPQLKDKIPAVETMLKEVLKMSGIDLEKLTKITAIGYLGSQDKVALIAEGIEAKSMKGEKQGDRNGVALYSMPNKIHYAELTGAGVVVASSPELVGQIVDTYSGKAKNIGETDKSKLLDKLVNSEKDLDQLRFYVLSGNLPNVGSIPFKLNGGAFFLHLDKGVAAVVVSDESGAGQVKMGLDALRMGLQASLATGGKMMNLPIELDADSKKFIGDLIKNIDTKQSGELVSIAYRGDLKPLIEKAVAMGFKEFGSAQAVAKEDMEELKKAAEEKDAKEEAATAKAANPPSTPDKKPVPALQLSPKKPGKKPPKKFQ